MRRLRATAAGAALVMATGLGACAHIDGAAAGCTETERLAIVAQSVPSASYVPCLDSLRPGWTAEGFAPRSGRTRFSLVSDRDPEHPVSVELDESCDTSGATPTTPRADGARTSLLISSISPRYAGTLFDLFAGGCVTYRFDFARGPHIGLIDDVENEVRLVARREVALALRQQYETELGP